MSEKSQKATPYKLKKAKEHGHISKSRDLNTTVLLLIFTAVIMALWPADLTEIKTLFRQVLLLAGRLHIGINEISHLQDHVASVLLRLWLPFALAGLLAVCLSTIAQTGMVWSLKPLVPNLSRLHFIKNAQRIFSMTAVFNTLKTTFKLLLTALLLGISIKQEIPTLLQFMTCPPADLFPLLFSLMSRMIVKLLALLCLFAALDKGYSRWKYAKDQRMSPQEMKEEYRQREGDPSLKRKIKQLQYQLRLKTTSLARLKTADVLITNPQHLAVALKYHRGIDAAPIVICKAQGKLVAQVKALAKTYHIHVVENKPLARMLYKTVALNQMIHQQHFPMVALIFRELYRSEITV